MAKLYFIYSSMGGGKTADLLRAWFNYKERGMETLLLTPAIDTRDGPGRISSRIGISAPAEIFSPRDDLFERFGKPARNRGIAAILVDEAQFATRNQVFQMARCVDTLEIPTLAYGLRTDFRGDLFQGSAALLGLADEIREMKSLCHCGRKATMVIRRDAKGNPTLDGAQVQIGGNESYQPVCRKHWMEAHGLLDDTTRHPALAV